MAVIHKWYLAIRNVVEAHRDEAGVRTQVETDNFSSPGKSQIKFGFCFFFTAHQLPTTQDKVHLLQNVHEETIKPFWK